MTVNATMAINNNNNKISHFGALVALRAVANHRSKVGRLVKRLHFVAFMTAAREGMQCAAAGRHCGGLLLLSLVVIPTNIAQVIIYEIKSTYINKLIGSGLSG